jgi:hypothetical protein
MPYKAVKRNCHLIGEISQPSTRKFPLIRDIIWYFLKFEEELTNRNEKSDKIVQLTQNKVLDLWRKSGILTRRKTNLLTNCENETFNFENFKFRLYF